MFNRSCNEEGKNKIKKILYKSYKLENAKKIRM